MCYLYINNIFVACCIHLKKKLIYVTLIKNNHNLLNFLRITIKKMSTKIEH